MLRKQISDRNRPDCKRLLMSPLRFAQRRKMVVLCGILALMFLLVFARLVFFCVVRADYYAARAQELHERERSIKAPRGRILDRNGWILADNKTVCNVSVIYSQMTDREKVIQVLSEELNLSSDYVRKRVEKRSSRERILENVPKEVGDRIREYDLPGVKVDEDSRRYYPFGELAGRVLGFTGADNQGIIGLEAYYDSVLKGKDGQILTVTDAKGIEVEREGERRVEPQRGKDLVISLDRNIQSYATQLAYQALQAKEAVRVSIIVMNPQNGEIYAMVSAPEFDPNNPFEIEGNFATEKERQDALNRMWRNPCISDTYEPGSTFKIITASSGLEEGVVSMGSSFYCPGYVVVEDRRIRCHKTTGHGSQDFVHAVMNSCNPSFVTLGLRLGVDRYYHYFQQFDLLKKTGVDLPGEAGTIMHRPENMGDVELATVSFGQSFQITPLRLLSTVSSIINGGKRITPHLAVKTLDSATGTEEVYDYPTQEGVVSPETSETMRYILEKVVSEGGGKNGAVAGYRIGGKTATSQTLPRGTGQYISSFLAFAPAEDPQLLSIAIIDRPKGSYYGGIIAAPVLRQLYENILPYSGVVMYNQEEN